MTRRGKRCLISLLLGLCLLMPSWTHVLAADAPEDSSSVQAVEEAMPDDGNLTTNEKKQANDTKVENINLNNTDEGKQNVLSDSSKDEKIYEEDEEEQEISVQDATYPATGKITAKVYLRYSNALPEQINQDFGETEFGPSGNNTPYFTVTVDLDAINKKPVKTYVVRYGDTQFIYYSIDSDSNWNVRGKSRVENATDLWEQAMLPAMSDEDQKKFENVFGNNMFVGYVLKRENNGWHIDGILKKDPPIYVVELYDPDDQAIFAISSNDTKLPGVSYADFKKKVEEELGGSNYNYLTEQKDQVILTYEKDGKTWKATITPKTDGTDKEYKDIYHVDPVKGKFSYRTVSKDTYYLSRMKIYVEDVTPVNLTISKKVKGSAANPQEHFTFILTAEKMAGKTLDIEYNGTQNCKESHSKKMTFDGNGIAAITLKHGETAKIKNVAAGEWKILEESGNYWTSVAVNGNHAAYDQKQGISFKIGNADVAAVFENQMERQPMTGISILTFPYLSLLMAGIAVLAGWYRKRKRSL